VFKANITICLFLSSVWLLTGCWDRKEINDIAIVMATAVDKKDDDYLVSVQFPLPGQMGGAGSGGGGGGTSGDKSWFMDSTAASTLRGSNDLQQQSVSRMLYFAHRRVLLVGEEMSKEGIAPIMDIVARMPQNRLTAYLVISKGQARDILNAKAPIEQIPSEMIRELAVQSMKNPRTVKHVIDNILSDGMDPIMPFVSYRNSDSGEKGKKVSTVRMEGLAVFKGDKLVGYMNEEKAMGVLWAMGEAKRPTVQVPAPKGKGQLSIHFAENSARLKSVVKDDEVVMHIEIKARGTVVDNDSDYGSINNGIIGIEQATSKEIKAMIEESVWELQNKYKSDAIGFGDVIHQEHASKWKKLKENWDEMYPKVKVKVNVRVIIEHTGSVIKPIAKKEEELQND
jgi:spore germination protein KC